MATRLGRLTQSSWPSSAHAAGSSAMGVRLCSAPNSGAARAASAASNPADALLLGHLGEPLLLRHASHQGQ